MSEGSKPRILGVFRLESVFSNSNYDRRRSIQRGIADRMVALGYTFDLIDRPEISQADLGKYDVVLLETLPETASFRGSLDDGKTRDEQFEQIRKTRPDLPVVVLYHRSFEELMYYFGGGATGYQQMCFDPGLIAEAMEKGIQRAYGISKK